MRPSIVATLGLTPVLLLAPRLGAALTFEDCERWLQQVHGEASGIEVSDPEGERERAALLEALERASLQRKGSTPSASLKDMSDFKKRAQRLAAEGRVSPVERERLETLSDTVRRCIEQVQKAPQ
jgi:hypothetical protein